jgi:cytochrome c peroxidase
LRNVAKTAPYSHNGYFSTLEAMVSFHADRGTVLPDVETNLVDPVTVPLTTQEISDIVAFLGGLTDRP